MKNRLKHSLILSGVILFGLALDILTKAIVVDKIPFGADVPFIDGVLHFTYRLNTGAAFSFMENSPWFFVVLTALVSIVLGYVLFSSKINNLVAFYSLGCVLTGGLGNLIDRFIHGAVVDMIDCKLFGIPVISFSPFSFSWSDFAIFNVADCFVTCGVLVFIVVFIVKKGEITSWSLLSEKKNEASDSTN